jgi:hypothetical protein
MGRHMVADPPYNPEELALFEQVLNRACADLGDCTKRTRLALAKRIFIRAEYGIRDFESLLEFAKAKEIMDRERI